MNTWLSTVMLLSIVLMAVNALMLYAVLWVVGSQYSFFRPWRVLLMGLMLHVTFLLVSDAWWYAAEIQGTPVVYARRLLVSRLLLTGVIWAYSLTWWRALVRLKPPKTPGNGDGR